MTDFSETAAEVIFSAQAVYKQGTGSAAMTVGQSVVYNATTGKWDLADCSTAAGAGTAKGLVGMVAAACAADGGPLKVCTYDPDLDPGYTMTVGEQGVISDTAGNWMPDSDLSAGEYVTVCIFPKSTSKCVFDPVVTGAVVAA